MKTWWLVLMSRSRRDSATTGLGNSGYQSTGDRLAVRISGCPAVARSLVSSYRSSAWPGVNSRMAKSSSNPDIGVSRLIPIPGLSRPFLRTEAESVLGGMTGPVLVIGDRDNPASAHNPLAPEQGAPRKEV